MATQTPANRENLFNVMKMKAPNGGVLDVTNTLIETNDLIADLPTYPANGGRFHEGTRVVSLPGASLINIGGGRTPSKTEREPFTEVLACIGNQYRSPVDVLQAEGPTMAREIVADEDRNHIESIGQGWSNLLLQGPSAPVQNAIEGLMGRAPWKNIAAGFCYDMGGNSSDLRSAWLIQPGATTVHALYDPNHPTLGVERIDHGKVEAYAVDTSATTITSSTAKRFEIVIDYNFTQGLCIRNVMAVKRIANIDVSASAALSQDLVDAIIDASLVKVPTARKPWFLYCDEMVNSRLVRAVNKMLFVYTSAANVYNTELPMIGTNIIIRSLDALNCAAALGETRIV